MSAMAEVLAGFWDCAEGVALVGLTAADVIGKFPRRVRAMAPALLVAQRARVVDLDGPLLLAKDRADGLRYEDSLVYPPTPALWG